MKRAAIVLIALGATAALLVPTVASPQFESTGTDRPSENLVMEPADGPNGDYAVLNAEDEIELLLTDANPDVEGDGINAGGVTPIPRVFTITYTGDRSAEVWITDDAEDVRFFRGDDPENDIEGAKDSVVLRPDETIAVGLLVDATDPDHDVEQANTFTVHARIADGASTTTQEAAVFDGGSTTAPRPTDADEIASTSTSGTSGSPTSSPAPTPTPSTRGPANRTPATTDRTKIGEISITPSSPETTGSPTPETAKSFAADRDRSSSSGTILELLPIGLLIALIGLLAATLRRQQG
ncbi:MAG: hypothetical protein ACI9YT_002884 [Halobacteriales archaeon]|jgi:hypothetical protein